VPTPEELVDAASQLAGGRSVGATTGSTFSASGWRARNSGIFQAAAAPAPCAAISSTKPSGVRVGNSGEDTATMSVRDPSGR